MKITSLLFTVVSLSLGLCAFTSFGDDWPGWRGPNRDDISLETGLLQDWPEGGPKRLWVSVGAGMGYAGFAVVENRLFTLGQFEDGEFGLCINTEDGKEIWRAKLGQGFENRWGDGPRNTPTVDNGNVYFMSARGDLACCTVADGQKTWEVTMESFGGQIPFWGYSESPLVDGDKIICTPGGEQGAIVALNKTNGKKIWQTSDLKQTAHYSSVISIEHNMVRQYVQLLFDAAVGIDAETGKVLWNVPFPGQTAVIPTPIYADGKVYVTSGYNAGSTLIELADDGTAKEVWHSRDMSNHHGGVIYMNGCFFGHGNGRTFVCQDLDSGKELWAEETLKKGAIAFADNRFYYIEEKSGDVVLFSADKKGWEQKGRFKLEPQSEKRSPQGAIWVHPVIANGKLYLRDQEIICCYDITSK